MDNENAQYEVLEAQQNKYNKDNDIQKRQWYSKKDNDIQKNPSVFSAGSTVVVQCEDGGPWTQGLTVEPNSINHRGHSYTILVTD